MQYVPAVLIILLSIFSQTTRAARSQELLRKQTSPTQTESFVAEREFSRFTQPLLTEEVESWRLGYDIYKGEIEKT